MIVSKFGGTSLADAGQIRKVASIVKSSPERTVVVVSAPGKRSRDDEKITDILISCHEAASQGADFSDRFALVRERYSSIAADLGIGTDLAPVLDEVERDIRGGADHSAVVSRGEYLGAHLVAAFLGYEFVDAAGIIRFSDQTTVDDAVTDGLIRERLGGAGPGGATPCVVPGFYGAFADGRVQLFSRGGSDITAALIARALDAEIYENWTDVSGLLSADPRVVTDPVPISRVTYRELRELAYLGANVFHDEAIAPVAQKGIPIQIRNTNEPDHPGTTIGVGGTGAEAASVAPASRATGVAGRTGFVTVFVERSLLSKDQRYLDRVRAGLLDLGVPVHHSVSGSDSLLLVCPADALEGRRQRVTGLLTGALGAQRLQIGAPLAVVGVVCRAGDVGPALLARAFDELGRADIGIRYVSVGESPHTAVFGIDEDRYQDGVRALYRAAVGQ